MKLFIDTNVFLLFYHLGSDDLEELKKLIELISQREIDLIITQQISDEFHRNRELKIKDAIKRLRDFKFHPSIPTFCKEYPEQAQLTRLLKEANKQHSNLIESVERDALSNSLTADKLIGQLFSSAETIPCDDEIYQRAIRRVKTGNPPGKTGSLGDAINWECLLQHVRDGDSLHLVSGDSDYVSVLDKRSLKEFLRREWKSAPSSNLCFYRTISEFFRANYPNIRLASEVEKDLLIDKLSQSGTFRRTHEIMSRLMAHTDFSPTQIERLVSIPDSNLQVGWIVGDPDLQEFYRKLAANNSGKITSALRDKVEKLMETEVEDSDDGIPF